MSFFTAGSEERQTDLPNKLIHVSIANHYDSERLGRQNATLQSKSSNLKLIKITVLIKILFPQVCLNNARLEMSRTSKCKSSDVRV